MACTCADHALRDSTVTYQLAVHTNVPTHTHIDGMASSLPHTGLVYVCVPVDGLTRKSIHTNDLALLDLLLILSYSGNATGHYYASIRALQVVCEH